MKIKDRGKIGDRDGCRSRAMFARGFSECDSPIRAGAVREETLSSSIVTRRKGRNNT